MKKLVVALILLLGLNIADAQVVITHPPVFCQETCNPYTGCTTYCH